jgi:GrpB-like predicted nucleotidyltransferase (UPF0157 family)
MPELRPFQVILAPHDPLWERRAALEGERLRGVLGAVLVEVHHIGSTAIAGIEAKPIVDLMPVVVGLGEFDRLQGAVEGLGYRVWGESGIEGRRYCTINDAVSGVREVQAHVFAAGDPHIERHLAFRDYMRAHWDEARAYEAEKRRCRDLHPTDSHAYSEAKSAWVRSAEARALAWWSARGGSASA